VDVAFKAERVSSLDSYFDALASAEPVPGGGSAAAVVGMAGAALVAMVARITAAAPRLAAVRDLAGTIAHQAELQRVALERARVEDEAAYAAVAAAMKLPKESDAEKAVRTQVLQRALARAAEAPLAIAGLARDVTQLAERALELGNDQLASDLGCAVEFASAAVRAAALNVRVNHRYIKDADLIGGQAGRLESIERDTDAALAATRARLGAPTAG
jgi:formiminotetrahydrofolate cyclodeaminase